MGKTFEKDPNAVLDYHIDWENWLGADTISTSTWTVPSGITKDADSKTTTRTTIWLSGGSAGSSYDLVNHIVTANTPARKDDRTITIKVVEK